LVFATISTYLTIEFILMTVKKLRILHAPTDVGNQPWGVSSAERLLGADSKVLVYHKIFKGFGSDYDLAFERRSRLGRLFIAMRYFLWSLWRFDVYHFYFATTFFPGYFDLSILKLFRKKIFFTFQGCDIRAADQCPPAVLNPEKHSHATVAVQQKRLKTILKYASKTYVLNPDLLVFSPTSEQLTYASVDVVNWPVHYPQHTPGKEVVIFHAPSDRLVKGSDYLEKAVNELKDEGYAVRLDLVTGVPHPVVLEHIQQADLVVDQLLVGWYGGFAIETMAMGKPTICYIRQDWLDWTPMKNDLPIVNASTETIKAVIKNLLDHPETWRSLGERSREFCLQYHDPKKIATRLLNDYANA